MSEKFFKHKYLERVRPELFDFFTKDYSLEDFCQFMFGFESKKAKKITAYLWEHFDLNLVNLIYIFSNRLQINKDLLYQAIENYEYDSFLNFRLIDFSVLKKMIDAYGEKRVVQMVFFEDSLVYLEDINELVDLCEERNLKEYFPMKPKPQSLEQLYAQLNSFALKYESEDFDLEQKAEVIALEGKIINGYQIKVPRTHYELVELGGLLNFCLGNGTYSKRVKKGTWSLITLYKNNKPYCCVQFSRYILKQARSFNNEVLPKDLVSFLEKELLSSPQVPDDYIPIESPFLVAYKYDNKDLYFMIKSREKLSFYKYLNIPFDIYESFSKSSRKNRFFSNIIKKSYKCQPLEINEVYN